MGPALPVGRIHVSKKAPISIISTGLEDHPAARAWRHLADERPVSIELWRDVTSTKPAVYKLAFEARRHPPVYGKRCPRSSLELERRIYEEILPHLPVSSPHYYGFHQEPDGVGWLFMEDVGGHRLEVHDPVQRAAAARWLGELHRSGAGLAAAASLPDAGPDRYLAHLRIARERIHRHAGNPGLTAEHHVLLGRIVDQFETVEPRWAAVERACSVLPVTLVHGDFRPKNVRVRFESGAPVLRPIDWEMAGWGVPAVDLAPTRHEGRRLQVDADVYESAIRARWPDADAGTVLRLRTIGYLFWSLAGISWDTENLVFEDPRWLDRPLASMRSLSNHLENAFAAVEAWLE